MARRLTGDVIYSDGQKWYLLWPISRDYSTGKELWMAENELGETRNIEL